ncbi:MAG TPA: glycosyltransferase family 2 protein [Aestuariivirgaceae bacterium]|nr:glycosyltransferase family 2 protein [Aestuariivirgaceae bacterium]
MSGVRIKKFLARLVVGALHSSVEPQRVLRRIARFQREGSRVSVIIPTKNGITNGLLRCVDSLRQQTHKNIEFIIVDSGSTDGTLDYLHERRSADFKVIEIRPEDFRHDHARNLGAENASGELLLFTVDDCLFEDPLWLEHMIAVKRAYRLTCISSVQIPREDADIYSRFLAFRFIKGVRLSPGLNIFGIFNPLGLFFRLIPGRQRSRFIHVDDVDNLCDREFFLKNRYGIHTCEDMELGSKVLRRGRRFGFNLIKGVRHSHDYADLGKYFDRVFIDVQAIAVICEGPQKSRRARPGILDSIISAYALIYSSYAAWIEQNHRNIIVGENLGSRPGLRRAHRVGRAHAVVRPPLFHNLGLAASIDLGLVNQKLVMQRSRRVNAIVEDMVQFFSPPFQQQTGLDTGLLVRTVFEAAFVNSMAADLARAANRIDDQTSHCSPHLLKLRWR